MASIGITLKVYANNLTNRSSLQALYHEIVRTLPEVKGVVNGAIILKDTLISNITMDAVEKPLKLKVDGSRYLDELFLNHELDFFILLSSTTPMWGNQG